MATLALVIRRPLLDVVGSRLDRGLDMERYGGAGLELTTMRAKLAFYVVCSFIGQVESRARGRRE